MTSHEQSESASEFKVVDRRRFTEDGESRETAPAAEQKSSEASTTTASQAEAPKASPSVNNEITFLMFVQSLAHQTFMALGLVPWPDSGLVKTELPMAKETIDVLSMLREKTKGNLSTDEDKFMESMLYELRLTYVRVLQGGAPVSPPPKS